MHRLILFRHAQAERAPAGGGDFDRPLTARGHDDARRMGRWLADRGEAIELALVSPALRAKQTWEEAAAALPAVRTDHQPGLYGGSPNVLLRAAEAAGAATVLLVAHNPGLHALALKLAAGAGGPADALTALDGEFPTAAVAIFARGPEGALAVEAFQSPAQLQVADA